MKYRVHGYMQVSCWTFVEAESPEEAIAEAQGRDPGGLTIQAIYPDDDECFHFDNDGAPMDLKAEPA
jgi:hypothetical protein